MTKEIEGTLDKLVLLLVHGDTGCLESLQLGKSVIDLGQRMALRRKALLSGFRSTQFSPSHPF